MGLWSLRNLILRIRCFVFSSDYGSLELDETSEGSGNHRAGVFHELKVAI